MCSVWGPRGTGPEQSFRPGALQAHGQAPHGEPEQGARTAWLPPSMSWLLRGGLAAEMTGTHSCSSFDCSFLANCFSLSFTSASCLAFISFRVTRPARRGEMGERVSYPESAKQQASGSRRGWHARASLTDGAGLELCLHSIIVCRELLVNVRFHDVLLLGREKSSEGHPPPHRGSGDLGSGPRSVSGLMMT